MVFLDRCLTLIIYYIVREAVIRISVNDRPDRERDMALQCKFEGRPWPLARILMHELTQAICYTYIYIYTYVHYNNNIYIYMCVHVCVSVGAHIAIAC